MEVACNLAPFAAASNNNLNPIMEQATLELESSDDSNEEMPTVLEPQVHSVVPNNCNKNNSAKKLVQIDETNGNNVVVEENNSPQQNNGNLSTNSGSNNNKYNNNIINNNINNFVQKSSTAINVQNKLEEIVNYETRENSNRVIFENSQSSTTATSTVTSVLNGGGVQKQVNKKVDTKPNRVKFLIGPDQSEPSEFDPKEPEMNHNLTSSQPLVLNGHAHMGNLTSSDLVENSKLANSHPHVTISSQNQDHAKHEDRIFGTKIDNSYQGWDNPFRPEGEISHDAEEILRLWKEGKRDFSLLLKDKDGDEYDEEENKNELDSMDHSMNASDELDSGKEPLLNNGSGIGTQQNGKAIKNGQNGVKKANNNKTSLVDVKTTSVQQKSEKVTLMGGDEPKKKQGCCSLM